MDEFGLLTRELGIRQPGKSAPMSASKPSSASSVGSRSADTNAFSDIFSGYKGPNPNLYPQLNSMPVYDDDDVVFGSTSNGGHVVVDDILGSLGSDSKRSDGLGGFEELMPGFRGSSPPNKREPEINQQRSAVSSDESPAGVLADPFAVFESTSSSAYPLPTDPLENLGRSMDPGSSNVNASSANGGTFDDNDAFDGFAKSVPLFTSGKNESRKVKSALESGPSRSVERYSRESFDNAIPRARPTQSFDSSSSIQSPKSNDSSYERNDTENQFPRYSEHLERADNAWLTISEIPLFTEPTRGPPPSRPPPPLVMKLKPYGRADLRRKGKENESYSPSTSSNLHPEVSEFAELERDEGIAPCAQDLGDREQWEREERERVQKILAKERELEREKARQERAEREAHERAVAEARAKAERAAFEKANNEARQRAERATAEARERALAEAREKAVRERINAEARERAAAEAHLRAERERVAAAATRERRYRTENDIESFFGMGARPNSVPKHRATTSDQSRGRADGAWQTFSTSSPIRTTSTTTNIVDDLTSIFGGASSYGEFQEVDGESEDRRRARFERHQRTHERTLKALAEKNERDMQMQREQAERHRIAETLDIEIKRWAFGKEGNLRALLSTLHYVLWPECGWQPVSLTDLITAASVKKVYRKATLCIHPDKVQQKGATLQQKCIAEKVFDILKEAWNKFNSEELF